MTPEGNNCFGVLLVVFMVQVWEWEFIKQLISKMEEEGRKDGSSEINDTLDDNSLQSFESCSMIRISTAPSRPLTDIEEFKLSKEFSMLEQTIVCSNHLIHKAYDKFDLDSNEGQTICQKYLEYLEKLAEAFKASTVSRDYRSGFSQAYKVLYKEGRLSYLTEILDSAQEGFPYLWVNGEKFEFTQQVLTHGLNLMTSFFRLQHFLRNIYSKVTQEAAGTNELLIRREIVENLEEFDVAWSNFQKTYVLELMDIEVKARSLISKAIEAEKCLNSVQIRQKMKGRILINCDDYMMMRRALCSLISEINQAANYYGKGRDDLDHRILCETEGILRKVTKEQSKAVRLLAENIRSSFMNIRALLRKYEKNIETVDPQLKNNADLVDVLVEYEKYWEKGLNYFVDVQKRRFLLHFSGIIEGTTEKYQKFKQLLECSDADVFLIIPCILMLKSLDNDDKHICKYFLPSLNQIETKTFRTYFQLQKQFAEWKRQAAEHYYYHNILEKIIIGVDLFAEQTAKYNSYKVSIDRIIFKLKNLAMELHRSNPMEWNSFMEICMAGAVSD